jgi:hypothetical protein
MLVSNIWLDKLVLLWQQYICLCLEEHVQLCQVVTWGVLFVGLLHGLWMGSDWVWTGAGCWGAMALLGCSEPLPLLRGRW